MPPPRRLSWGSVLGLLALSDVLTTTSAVALAYWLRFHWSSIAGLEPRVPNFPVWMMLPFGVAFLLAFTLIGVYRRENVVSGLDEYGRIFAAGGMAVLIVIVVSYLTTFVAVSRGFLLLSLGLVTLSVCLGRFAVRRAIYRAARHGRCLETAVIVGVNSESIRVAHQLSRNSSASITVAGFLSDFRPKGSHVVDGLTVLGDPSDIESVARGVGANRAVVVESGLAWESLRAIVMVMHRQRHFAISLVPGMFELHATPMQSVHLGPVMTLSPHRSRIVGFDAWAKRTLDIVIGSVALVLAVPVMAVLAISACGAGKGFGIERHQFLAMGRQITLVRFAHPWWARRAHLSRLPELVKVVTGRMSLIGPRPVGVESAGTYGRSPSFIEPAKPGFIGPWWVAGLERPESPEQELAYDLNYLRNYSIWSDLQVLIQVFRYGLLRSARRRPPDQSLPFPGDLGKQGRTDP
jgi:lipopolysaccharide/colanic/teichoic acid biosynthesis glycosyltransferase